MRKMFLRNPLNVLLTPSEKLKYLKKKKIAKCTR